MREQIGVTHQSLVQSEAAAADLALE